MRQSQISRAGFTCALFALLVAGSNPAAAACQNSGKFSTWLNEYRQEAAANGISQRTIRAALGGMTLDRGVIRRDRRQGFFGQSFYSFSRKLATQHRLNAGRKKLKKYNSIYARAEKEYGVPGPVITAFWALESDFGVGMGDLPVLRSLATLAYDCRRSDMFRAELTAALKIIDRGDLKPSEMIGSWAGELGQTQFLPTHYLNHAIDYDGDGRRNLFRSSADIIGSTAAYINHIGWRRGEPWIQEVVLTKNLPWDQADLKIKHPRSKWIAWGVKPRKGQSLPNDNLPASLLIPMGRKGTAFLAYQNFDVYLEWNQSLNYSTTAAYLATRMAGAPSMRRPQGIPTLTLDQAKLMQRILTKRGFDVGKIDGIIGAKTRTAVKAMQKKYGMPADSYPTPALLARLRQ